MYRLEVDKALPRSIHSGVPFKLFLTTVKAISSMGSWGSFMRENQLGRTSTLMLHIDQSSLVL